MAITKICNDCKVEKPVEEFARRKAIKSGLAPYCRPCNVIRTKSPRGLAARLTKNQRLSSKRRGHPVPAYTTEELYEWLIAQPHFNELYEAYVASGYDSNLKPSADRLDDTLPYTFDNIQLVTWDRNFKIYKAKQRDGEAPSMLKAVIQMDLDGNFIQEFASVSIAAKSIPNGSHGVIAQVCRGEPNGNGTDQSGKPVKVVRRTAYGFKWKWK